MFINFWYCAALGRNLTEKPLRVRMLGQDFALFRDSSGKAHCLHDVCVHRGASLAGGLVKDNCIQCPYHGWLYDNEGNCKHIPTLVETDAKIPARASVDSYPVEEKYGLIFVFLGDIPTEDRPPMLEVNEWDKAGWDQTIQEWELDYPYLRAVENAMDVFHNDLVHPEFMIPDEYQGSRKVELLNFTETDWSTTFTTKLPGNELDENTGMTTIQSNQTSEVSTGHISVSNYFSFVQISKEHRLCLYFFATPLDQGRTRVTLLTTRNFMPGKDQDIKMMKGNEHILMQDVQVVKRIQSGMVPDTNATELLLPEDRGVIGYRKRTRDWTKRGWKIDTVSLAADNSNRVYAIPSPARRTKSNWVTQPIPLVQAIN
ncbi:MAG: aromatic ring-hydroxylating dioxygenase subunit alpha [Pseudomonadota bacterium]|nr:aromatic ring-hydroxylating dioxygenase subunit alpha [Pseudomonadota bacterium]